VLVGCGSVSGTDAQLLPPDADPSTPTATPTPTPTPTTTPEQEQLPTGSLLPGHQPGLVYVGFAAPEQVYEQEVSRVGATSLRRGRYVRIGDVDGEIASMRASLARGRLPWTSFSGNWREVAAGEWDEVLRRRFAAYRELGAPALVTFAHEPIGDGDPQDFVAAWRHLLDLADAEGTGQVSLVPIMNGYVWGTWAEWPDWRIRRWLPDDLLQRWPMVGVDIYHGATVDDPGQPPAERMEELLAWADRNGVALLGIGETGVHDAQSWQDTWAFVESHSDRFMAVSYFNSRRNVRPGAAWYLDEETLAEFRGSLLSPVVARLEMVVDVNAFQAASAPTN
jgi:hypothetical protein